VEVRGINSTNKGAAFSRLIGIFDVFGWEGLEPDIYGGQRICFNGVLGRGETLRCLRSTDIHSVRGRGPMRATVPRHVSQSTASS